MCNVYPPIDGMIQDISYAWIIARNNAQGANWDDRPLDGRLRLSPVRSPESPKPTPKAHASIAVIAQVEGTLERCRLLTRIETLELRTQAPHGRRRGSCFGHRSLGHRRNPRRKRGHTLTDHRPSGSRGRKGEGRLFSARPSPASRTGGRRWRFASTPNAGTMGSSPGSPLGGLRKTVPDRGKGRRIA